MPSEINDLPSDRTFGLVMAGVAAGLAVIFVRSDRLLGAELAGSAALLLASAAFLKPRLLAPLTRCWMALGKLIGKIVSPIVLGILFFGLFTPIALILRLLGRDELRLRKAPGSAGYWCPRDPPGPEPGSFRRQF